MDFSEFEHCRDDVHKSIKCTKKTFFSLSELNVEMLHILSIKILSLTNLMLYFHKYRILSINQSLSRAVFTQTEKFFVPLGFELLGHLESWPHYF